LTILSLAEAASLLRITPVPDAEHPDLTLDLVLAGVDDYLKTATGHDWAADAVISPSAKMAAMMLATMWYENPAMIGDASPAPYGLHSQIAQLQAKSLES
jgi:hypothetical protein